ncbi:IS66 family insertion sequence element accessory protein TnpA [Colwellia chukchiensis]|nr:hypothetical protein [Colwellia chukchiensis]
MQRRTLDDWKSLVDKQIASGLSVPKFCQQHQLNPKYFYGRKATIVKNESQTGFMQAHVVTQHTMMVSEHQKANFSLTTSAGELSLPGTTSAPFLIELLNGLAP